MTVRAESYVEPVPADHADHGPDFSSGSRSRFGRIILMAMIVAASGTVTATERAAEDTSTAP